jgi:signal peptidase II
MQISPAHLPQAGITQMKFLLLAISLIIVDQLSKYIVRHSGGFYICNPGIAFGIQIPDFLIWIIYAVIIIFACYCFFKKTGFKIINKSQIYNSKKILEKLEIGNWNFIGNWKLEIRNYFPIILILSGAFSNLIDRLRYGCVIDFIDLRFWPVFNLADAFITIGGIMIIVCWIKKMRKL